MTAPILRTAAFAVLLATASVSAQTVTENFSSNPIGGTWNFGVGNNSNSQFSWNNTAPAYTGDSAGSLTVSNNAALPNVRLQRSLGQSHTLANDFSLSSVFSINPASGDGFVQMAFGLVNSATTGGNRTSFPSDTFNSIEWNYFPYANGFGTGPTLQHVAFGPNPGSGNAFDNAVWGFGVAWDYTLPVNTLLSSTISYDSTSSNLTLSVSSVNPDGSLTFLHNAPVLNLNSLTGTFSFDSMAIMAYNNGGFGSLEGTMTFHSMQFVSPIPEPGTWALMALGAVSLGMAWRRKLRQTRTDAAS